MDIARRTLLAGAAAGWAASARAAGFPAKPIRLIVGYPPGASTDFSARVVAAGMAARLGQNVVVENRPGANSMIGVDYVAKSPRDGYTLMWANADATSLLAAEKADIPYDIARDFTFISRAVQFGYALAVGTGLKLGSVAALVAGARAAPGVKYTFGSVGVGGAAQIAAVQFGQRAGISLTHVPYKGAADELTDILAGRIAMGFLPLASVDEQAKAGNLRVLAVTSDARDPSAPGVPTMAEAGFPGAALTNWLGILGPAGLPPEVADRLERTAVDTLGDPAVGQRLASVGMTPAPLTGDGYRKLVLDELAQWRSVAQAAHITLQ